MNNFNKIVFAVFTYIGVCSFSNAAVVEIYNVTQFGTLSDPSEVGVTASANLLSGHDLNINFGSGYQYTQNEDYNNGIITVSLVTDINPGSLNISINATNNTNVEWDMWGFAFSEPQPGAGAWNNIYSSATGSVTTDPFLPVVLYEFDAALGIGESFTMNATLASDTGLFMYGPDVMYVSMGPVVDTSTVSTVPVPAAVWLFGSGLLGLIGMARRKKNI